MTTLHHPRLGKLENDYDGRRRRRRQHLFRTRTRFARAVAQRTAPSMTTNKGTTTTTNRVNPTGTMIICDLNLKISLISLLIGVAVCVASASVAAQAAGRAHPRLLHERPSLESAAPYAPQQRQDTADTYRLRRAPASAGDQNRQLAGPNFGQSAGSRQLDAGDEAAASAAALEADASGEPEQAADAGEDSALGSETGDELTDDSHETPDRQADNLHMLERHNLNLRAMHDMFERRQLLGAGPAHHQNQMHQQQHSSAAAANSNSAVAPLQSSQELSPISIGLDPRVPFGLGNPFSLGAGGPDSLSPVPPPPVAHMAGHPHKPQMANADNLDPALPFGLNPLPQLLGFQGGPAANGFDGPQRGDQSAHSNHHSVAPSPQAGDPSDSAVGGTGGHKVWPKIFRFTDGRINLSDFEKQKKVRLSNKNQHSGDNHIETAPIMFDGRQLKRKSFLILHGGIFSRR